MMRRTCRIAAGLLGLFAGAAVAEAPRSLDLAGEWSFALDPDDRGIANRWFERAVLPDRIRLPGSLQEQGLGDEICVDTPWTGQIVDRSYFTEERYAPYRQPGHIKVPFWLQPDRHYVGAAWYGRTFEVPDSWRGKRLVLSLERPHWVTRVWLDGREVGTRDSLSTPHTYDLGTAVKPGEHRLMIQVDNRLAVEVGVNSHSVSDHTQTNWNGIVGRLALTATKPVWIADLRLDPDVSRREVTIRGRIGNATGRPGEGDLRLSVVPPDGATEIEENQRESWTAEGGTFEATIPLGGAATTWDEFRPSLYRVTATLDPGESCSANFGLRQIATEGTRFLLNGRPIFLRGTLECCIFPRTGYPPTDETEWERILRVVKTHGLNHVRFHSWCPPEAAFAAADRLGVYFHVECASWANSGTAVGEGRPLDDWLYREADRILAAYGNHPSFLLMAYGNEPAGPPGRGEGYLGPWVEHFQAKDARRLYTSAAGWPMIPQNQYHVTPTPRIQQWGEGLASRINGQPPATTADYRDFVQGQGVPVISHEIGQWCVYPNFDEIPKYTGHLKAKNFEIFRDFLESRHMGDQARDFLMASGKLQVACYKEEIESALRTPGFGGFELLDLHDFPGQGTALVGVLDPFWDSKPYVTPAEFRRFCGPTIPLARLGQRVFSTAEALVATIELSHFGTADLEDAVVTWRVESDTGTVAATGRFAPRDYPTGDLHSVGEVRVPLRGLDVPRRWRLIVGIEGTDVENDWNLWVFPPRAAGAEPADVLVTRDLDAEALARLKAGGKVLLLPPPERVVGGVALGFSTVFWNTAWTRDQPPHTLGLLCDPRHPALAAFPTEFHSDWQWWELVHNGGAMLLDTLPPKLRPIIQPIDTWFRAHRLGLAFEARVAGGKLLVCSMDLTTDLDRRHAARQMRASLLAYMAGERFTPRVEIEADALRALIRPPSNPKRIEATSLGGGVRAGRRVSEGEAP